MYCEYTAMLHYLDWFGFILYQCFTSTQYLLFIITFLHIDLNAHPGAVLHCRAAPLRIVRTGLHWFLPSTDFPLLILTNQSLPQSRLLSQPLHLSTKWLSSTWEVGKQEVGSQTCRCCLFRSVLWGGNSVLGFSCSVTACSGTGNWCYGQPPHSQCSCCYGNRSTRAHLFPALQTLAPGNLRHFGPGSV